MEQRKARIIPIAQSNTRPLTCIEQAALEHAGKIQRAASRIAPVHVTRGATASVLAPRNNTVASKLLAVSHLLMCLATEIQGLQAEMEKAR